MIILMTINGCGNNNPDLVKLQETGECIECNLAGVNLRKAKLRVANLSGANLSGANLSGAKLEGSNLIGANLSGANLSGANLMDSDVSRANLSGANLREAVASRSYFIGTDLAGANLTETVFNYSHLDGANLSGATLSGSGLHFSETTFIGANLTKTNLSGAKVGDHNDFRFAIFCNTTMPDGVKNDGCEWDLLQHAKQLKLILVSLTESYADEQAEREIRFEKKFNEAQKEKERKLRQYGSGTLKEQFYRCVELLRRTTAVDIPYARRFCQNDTGYDWANSGDQ